MSEEQIATTVDPQLLLNFISRIETGQSDTNGRLLELQAEIAAVKIGVSRIEDQFGREISALKEGVDLNASNFIGLQNEVQDIRKIVASLQNAENVSAPTPSGQLDLMWQEAFPQVQQQVQNLVAEQLESGSQFENSIVERVATRLETTAFDQRGNLLAQKPREASNSTPKADSVTEVGIGLAAKLIASKSDGST